MAINIDLVKNEEVSIVEKEWEHIVKSISDPVIILDLDNKILFANPASAKAAGKKEGELIGNYCYEVFHCSHEPPEECPYEKLKKSKNPETIVMEMEAVGGHYLVSVSPIFDDNGHITKVIHIAKNITEKKKAEEALQKKVQELTVLYQVSKQVTSNLSMDQVSKACLNGIDLAISPDLSLLFLRDHEKLVLLGTKFTDPSFQHAETPVHKVGECLCGIAVAEGKPIFSIDINSDSRCTFEECKKAGLVSFAALPLKGGDKIIGVMGIASGKKTDFEEQGPFLETLSNEIAIGLQNSIFFRQVKEKGDKLKETNINLRAEINRRNSIEKNLEKAFDELKSLDQLKTDVIANISHELKTPITIMQGCMELAMEEDIHKEKQYLLEKGLTALKRQETIINDLVSLSMVSATKPHLRDENFGKIITELILSKSEDAKNKGININWEIEEDLPPVPMDSEKIVQVIGNLLDNAIKFNRENGSISVKVGIIDGIVEVSVSDIGIGIEQENLERVFKPLTQLDPSSKRKYGGTGTGLAVAKKFIEAHGGKIWAESDFGNGSTFYFTLPIQKIINGQKAVHSQ